jgi:hypothetical protein
LIDITDVLGIEAEESVQSSKFKVQSQGNSGHKQL